MHNKILLMLAAIVALAGCRGIAVSNDDAMEKNVQKIVSRMTLEEKIGQMTQINSPLLCGWGNGPVATEDLLEKFIGEYKVGSFLNCPQGHSETPEVYRALLRQIQDKSMEVMGIPTIFGLDQNHGASYTAGGTIFPQEINLGATFNPELARRMGEICAAETRACYVAWTFNPTMDLGRNCVWPRLWESFGEDALVQAEMGKALQKGYQGPDRNRIDERHIAACIKHYMGYGVPVSGQDRTPAIIAYNDLREKFFEPFKECLKDGALSLMVNSSSINGIPVHASYELLTQWTKKDLGWDGVIVTDWADINNLWQREKVATDEKDAIRISINAGVDMSMVPTSLSFCDLLKELVEEGSVKMSRIDDAVSRIIRMKMRLGLFDNPCPDPEIYADFACAASAEAAYRTALESEVLLKNEGAVLPIGAGRKILVTGPNANSMRTLNGGWTHTWQGSFVEPYSERFNTIYEALAAKFGAGNVKYVPGVEYDFTSEDWQAEKAGGIAAAVSATRGCDVIVACVGENSYCETPGNVKDIRLSTNQIELVKALAATGKPVVLVYNGGRPRVIAEIEPLVAAVIDVMLPGDHGADALAALLSGEENFSAKLPYTWPKHTNSLATYDYKVSEKVGTMEGDYNYDAIMDVQWTFGDGLSYTSYEYSNLRIDKASFAPGDELKISVDVRNVGALAGSEPVLLFSSDLVASIVPDSRRLRAFEKIGLQPGETKTVVFSIPASRLAFVGHDNRWRLEKGDFRFTCGNQSVLATCTADKVWRTPNI